MRKEYLSGPTESGVDKQKKITTLSPVQETTNNDPELLRRASVLSRLENAFETPELVSLRGSDLIAIKSGIAAHRNELLRVITVKHYPLPDSAYGTEKAFIKLTTSIDRMVNRRDSSFIDPLSKPVDAPKDPLPSALKRVKDIKETYEKHETSSGYQGVNYRVYPQLGLFKTILNTLDDSLGSETKSGFDVFSSILLKGERQEQRPASEDHIVLPTINIEVVKFLLLVKEQNLSSSEIAKKMWPEAKDWSDGKKMTMVRRFTEKARPFIIQNGLDIASNKAKGYSLTLSEDV